MSSTSRAAADSRAAAEPVPAGLADDAVPARDYLVPLLVLLLIFAPFYWHGLSNFTLSIDDEWAAVRESAVIWLREGRWGVYLVERFLMPRPVIPFLPLALFGLCGAAGYLAVLRSLGVRRPAIVHYALFPIFIAYPTWQFLAAFAANIPSAGIGVLACGLAAMIFAGMIDRRRGVGLLPPIAAQVALGALAAGLYQALLLFQLALYLGVILVRTPAVPAATSVRRIALAAAVMVLSAGLYLLIARLLLSLTAGFSEHIESFLQADRLLLEPLAVLGRIAGEAWLTYTGSAAVYGTIVPSLALPLLFGLAGVGFAARNATRPVRMVVAAIVLGLLPAPFLINLVSGGIVPYRTLVAVPAVVTLFGLIGFAFAPRALARVAICLLPVVYYQMLTVAGSFYAANDLARIHDRLLAATLYERIVRKVPNFDRTKPYPINVFGAKLFETVYPRVFSSTLGFSFFEWDGGYGVRIANYMKLLGFANLYFPGPDVRSASAGAFAAMPVWPAEGSVQFVNDVVLVKLSEVPGYIDAIPATPIAAASPPPLFRLSAAPAGLWRTNPSGLVAGADGIDLGSASDPHVVFLAGEARAVAACAAIDVSALVRPSGPDTVQFFFSTPAFPDFTDVGSRRAEISPAADGGFVEVGFVVGNSTGFLNRFRLDPGNGGHPTAIKEIVLRCREPIPGVSGTP